MPHGSRYALHVERLVADPKMQAALADYDARSDYETGSTQHWAGYDCLIGGKISGRHAASRTAKAWQLARAKTATQYLSDNRKWARSQLARFLWRSRHMVIPGIGEARKLSRRELLRWELDELRAQLAPRASKPERKKRQGKKST